MIVAAALLIAFVGLSVLILWRLAIYALPLWCGAAFALWFYREGSGFILALLAGLAAAIAVLVFAQWLLGLAKSPLLRASVGLAFATPAAIAGFHAGHGIAANFLAEGIGLTALATLAGAATGIAAWGGTLNQSNPRPAAPDAAR